MLGLFFASSARADIVMDFGSANTGQIQFVGNGTGASIQFIPTGSGNNFQINNESGTDSTNSALSLYGNVQGTFHYTGSGSSALLTTDAGATLSITDASNNVLTGQLTGVSIAVSNNGGFLNPTEILNLTGVTYSGTNADLVTLATLGGGNGAASVGFSFFGAQNITLADLNNGTHTTSFQGELGTGAEFITSVPEPSTLAIAGLGALGMIGYGLRRRKA